MENKKKQSAGGNSNHFNGVIVAYTLKKLQEEKGEQERISFEELYQEITKTKQMSRDTVARRLKVWKENITLSGIRGELLVYDRKGRKLEDIEENEESEETNVTKEEMESEEEKQKRRRNEQRERYSGMKRFKTSSFRVEKAKDEYHGWEGGSGEKRAQMDHSDENKNEKSGYYDMKREIDDYADVFIQVIKKEKEIIGTGNDVAEKVYHEIRRWNASVSEAEHGICKDTILRYVCDLLNPKNKKVCDLLQIEIGIKQELPAEIYTQAEEKLPEECFVSIRHRASIDPEEITSLHFENKNEYIKLKSMNLRICDKSQVWEQQWTENFGGSEDVPYMEFILKRDQKGEIWAVSYEILKVLCDNQEQEMSEKEIIKGLYQFIPDTYLSRKEFGEEFKKALRFIEKEGMAKRKQEGKWILGEFA